MLNDASLIFTFVVKQQINGDGTGLDHNDSIVNIGLRFLGLGDENSPNAHHCLALAVGEEKYPLLEKLFDQLAKDLEDLKSNGIIVNGIKRTVRLLLCADWKFMRK
jgi:hypothetical protein